LCLIICANQKTKHDTYPTNLCAQLKNIKGQKILLLIGRYAQKKKNLNAKENLNDTTRIYLVCYHWESNQNAKKKKKKKKKKFMLIFSSTIECPKLSP